MDDLWLLENMAPELFEEKMANGWDPFSGHEAPSVLQYPIEDEDPYEVKEYSDYYDEDYSDCEEYSDYSDYGDTTCSYCGGDHWDSVSGAVAVCEVQLRCELEYKSSLASRKAGMMSTGYHPYEKPSGSFKRLSEVEAQLKKAS